MLDVLRGGVPAPTRTSLSGIGAGTDLSLSYDLNSAYLPRYDKEFLNFWTITKEQLNIFIGIELFYGNYSEYLVVYISRLHDKLAELVSLYSKTQQLPREVERAMLAGGLQAAEKKLAEQEETHKKFKEVQSYVSEHIIEIAEEIGLDTDDLLEVLKPYLSDGQEQ